MGNFRDSYNRPSETEVEYAHEVAEKLTEPEEEKSIRLVRSGQKRQEYGSSNLPPFTGCTKDESDLIRHLIGLKFAGYTQREAFDKADINPSTATSMMRRCPEAVRECKQEHLARCMEDINTNAKMLKYALSEMAPMAVKTLGAVMSDPKEKGFNKTKAAELVLKLAGVEEVSSDNPDVVQEPFLITLQDNRTEIESDSIHVVEADEAEVLGDEDADRDECASGVC